MHRKNVLKWLLLMASTCVCAHGTPAVGVPATAAVLSGGSYQAIATSQITNGPGDPALIPGGVNLLRVDGPAPLILGAMHDDGLNGDALAGDGTYSLSFTATAGSIGQLQLQVSAAFRGLVRRRLSATGTVETVVPSLLQVSPNTGQQGQQNLSVTLTGQDAHWTQGVTTARFGAGVTVASLTVNSPATATAVLNIDPAAAVGVLDVTVSTNAEALRRTNGFILAPGTPAVLSITPNAGWPGKNGIPAVERKVLLLTPEGGAALPTTNALEAAGFTWVLGSLAPGQIASRLTPEFCCVYIWMDGGAWVPIAPPDPSMAFNAADRAALVAFSQTHRNFIMDGLSMRDYYHSSEADSAALTQNEALLLANAGGGILLGADDTAGGKGVQHVNQVLSWFGFNPFTKVLNAPGDVLRCGGLFCSTPHTLNFRDLISTGTYSDLPHGLQPNGIYLDTLVFGSPTTVYTIVLYDPTPPAPDTLGGVAYPAVDHVITTSIPGLGTNSTAAFSVTITGQFTHFTDASTVDLGPGITIANLLALDPTHLTADIAVDPGTTPSVRPLSVTTGTETVTLASAFTVGSTPALVSITPGTAKQGATGVPVTITGQNTHFTNNSKIDLWTGVTVSSIVAVDSTHLTALLTIALGAPPGPHNLSVTTDLGTNIEVVSLPAGFTVAQGPILVTLSPSTIYPGRAIPVTITGQDTHFTNASTIDIGMGITASSITAVDATHLTAVLAISPGVAVTRDVTVTTNLGTARKWPACRAA